MVHTLLSASVVLMVLSSAFHVFQRSIIADIHSGNQLLRQAMSSLLDALTPSRGHTKEIQETISPNYCTANIYWSLWRMFGTQALQLDRAVDATPPPPRRHICACRGILLSSSGRVQHLRIHALLRSLLFFVFLLIPFSKTPRCLLLTLLARPTATSKALLQHP